MKLSLLALAMATLAFAGCGDDAAEPSASKAPTTAPTTASGGATGSAPTGPAGDTSAQAPAAKEGGSPAEAKPDPGDANDHSNPQHDAKNKKNAD